MGGLLWLGLGYGVVLLAMTLALFVVPLGLPGVWIMVGLAGVLALVGGISWTTWLALALLAGAAELAEWVTVSKLGRMYGGSKQAFWGAIAGGFIGLFVGLPVPVVGSILTAFVGSFAGAAVVTFVETRSMRDAGRVGWGTVLGRILATGLKVAAGVIVLLVTGTALLVG